VIWVSSLKHNTKLRIFDFYFQTQHQLCDLSSWSQAQHQNAYFEFPVSGKRRLNNDKNRTKPKEELWTVRLNNIPILPKPTQLCEN
jgi:hypothetical protein